MWFVKSNVIVWEEDGLSALESLEQSTSRENNLWHVPQAPAPSSAAPPATPIQDTNENTSPGEPWEPDIRQCC